MNEFQQAVIWVFDVLGLCSSDDEASEDEDVEMLPWQPEWFSASSDEDNNEDEYVFEVLKLIPPNYPNLSI